MNFSGNELALKIFLVTLFHHFHINHRGTNKELKPRSHRAVGHLKTWNGGIKNYKDYGYKHELPVIGNEGGVAVIYSTNFSITQCCITHHHFKSIIFESRPLSGVSAKFHLRLVLATVCRPPLEFTDILNSIGIR